VSQFRLSFPLFRRWFVLPLALGALGPFACDDDGRIEIVVPPDNFQDGGGFSDGEAFDGDANNDGNVDDVVDAGSSPVLLGVTPNPRGDGAPAIGDVIDARLTVIASGARAVVIRRLPAELTSDAAWSQLQIEASTYGKNGIVVNFVFAVVDGNARGLEEAISGLAWNDTTLLKAMYARIDQIMARLGGTAPYFIVGRDVDIFLAAHPDERPALEAFLLELVSYVRTHSLAPPNMRVGVGFSFAGATSPDPSWSTLLAASDIAACSYLPGLGTESAGLASNVAADADALVVSAQGKPVVIEALGYPSSDVVGGSDTKQALFFESVFTVLGTRRAAFAFVNIDELHDLASGRCADRATFQGKAVDGLWATYSCSLGLFASDGQPKSSWQVVVNGAAAFALP
jgi:hypothetical protein